MSDELQVGMRVRVDWWHRRKKYARYGTVARTHYRQRKMGWFVYVLVDNMGQDPIQFLRRHVHKEGIDV